MLIVHKCVVHPLVDKDRVQPPGIGKIRNLQASELKGYLPVSPRVGNDDLQDIPDPQGNILYVRVGSTPAY